MIETVFTTENLPAEERFACWRELTCRTLVPTQARCHDEANFLASTLVRGSNTLQVYTETVISPWSAERTQKLVRRSDPEKYLLGVVRTGTCGFSRGSRETTLGAGDLILIDSSQPFRARRESGTHEILVLPKAVLPLSAAEVAPLLAGRLSGREGIGAVLSRCLHEITSPGIRDRAADIVRLLDTALELLTTMLAHELHSLHAVPPESRQRALLARVHTFIHQHLGDPELSPRTVADAHHVSLRQLQQALAVTGTTPAALIRRKRLQQCRRALADPGLSRRTIHAIAARWGFTDHAHFSRLFRATYGASPSEYRASHHLLVREPTNPLRE
ncbi:AraC family transcriptional regulator [Streptomyces camponoticapitis]|uniref:AraC family transcriptional regulator n=1 Tax=Streptomyces camponoticapitis TaxID=1616125 RepID=A0ABQ2EYA5_9ACTN|nr:helix-turn-helix domain-containing protein [Streptomyces camponoticapitis]GGK27720.1 AraC family transcriptional regulator [Streptomyces camponoticapitis]